MKWDQTYRRIFCIGHVINLAVQAFLFHDIVDIEQFSLYDEQEVMEEEGANDIQRKATFHSIGPLGKLHNIVAHISGSAGRTKSSKIWLGG